MSPAEAPDVAAAASVCSVLPPTSVSSASIVAPVAVAVTSPRSARLTISA